jgi:hypothetical protein
LFDRSEPSGFHLEHHKSLDELKAAAHKRCKICTIVCEMAATANETRAEASIRSGYSKPSFSSSASSDAFSLSLSIFPPPPEALERHNRYGIRFDKLAEFWVIPDANAV